MDRCAVELQQKKGVRLHYRIPGRKASAEWVMPISTITSKKIRNMTEGNWHRHKYSRYEFITTAFVVVFLVTMFVKFLFF